jgi:hypothetical protein
MWLTPPLKTTLTNSVKDLSLSNSNLFDTLKGELSHEEEMDTIIGKGGVYCGCYKVSDGKIISIKHLSSNETEIKIEFIFTSVSRSSGSLVGDVPKKCEVTLQVDPQSGVLSSLTFPKYQNT